MMFQQRIPQELILSVLTYRDQPSGLRHTFDQRGGTLGRAPECDLVLEDESKTISRIHARAVFRDGHFMLCSLGTNPIQIGERMIATGEAMQLEHGQQIQLGDYRLAVELLFAPGANADSSLVIDPMASQALGKPASQSAPMPLPGVDESDAMASLGLNLFGGVLAPMSKPALLDLSGSNPRQQGSVESSRESQKTPLPFNLAIPADYDPLADAQKSAPTNSSQGTTTGNAPLQLDPILAALLEGMGLSPSSVSMKPVELARLAGVLLRELTAGTMAACITRSLTKSETQLDVTLLNGRANNPLKFFPKAEQALTQFFSTPSSAYLSPELAIQGAFDDLRTHELAMIAASRAAMSDVLRQISPPEIEQQLKTEGALDHVFQSHRKARCWDGLIQRYAALDMQSEEDAQRFYARQFSLAYAQQIARIKQKKMASR